MQEKLKFETIKEMIGKTYHTVVGDKGGEALIFVSKDQTVTFAHNQDCCETVDIEDVSGDLSDLVGEEILMAESAVCDDPSPSDGAGQWTFYKFATRRGFVTVRFYGSSNGYYSTSVEVHFEEGRYDCAF